MKNNLSRSYKIGALVILLLTSSSLSGCTGEDLLTGSSWAGLAADDSYVYVAFNQAVSAVDLRTGIERWRFPQKPERSQSFYAPPAISDDLLIIGGYDHVVYALNIGSGSESWRFTGSRDRIIGGPAIADNLVLVPSADGTLYALDRNSGIEQWKFEAEKALWSRPLVENDRIYLSSMDHHVYALTHSGDLIWKTNVGEAIVDTPTKAGDLLVIGTFGKRVIALDAERGQQRWAFETQGWVWGNPAVSDNLVLFGDLAGYFYAISLNGGRAQWSFQPNSPVTSSPVLQDDFVYFVTEEGLVYARDSQTNLSKWQVNLGSQCFSEPLLHEEKLIVATMNIETLLVAINQDSGSQIWTYNAKQ